MSHLLALDVGETSLGWALLDTKDGEIIDVKNMGVRIYPDGREDKSKEPLAVTRRLARGASRNLDRKNERKNKLMALLIENKLMPEDKEERKKQESLNPYELRSRGAEEALKPYELGRALWHICQRRGFKSNRKADKGNDDKSLMKVATKELENKIKENNCKTLGQYLYSLQQKSIHNNLRVNVQKIKGKNNYNFFPTREMYAKELEIIFAKQNISLELQQEITDLILNQRPLKPQKVGMCIFESGEERAPKACLAFQRSRYLQNLNNLELDDWENGECLSGEQKQEIKKLLEVSEKVSFDKIRKTLKLDKNLGFNLEREKNKDLKGNETSALLGNKKAFGAVWFDFPSEEQEKIVKMIINAEKDEDLIAALMADYHLSAEQASHIAEINLPAGYGKISIKALNKINPFLEQGLGYADACVAAEYHHSNFVKDVLPKLPYYGEVLQDEIIPGTGEPEDKANPEKYFGKINNPTVHIGLNQIRKLVNEIIDVYGAPEEIAVEFCRELKMSRQEKKDVEKEQAANQKKNEEINAKLREFGFDENYNNRMMYKLWEDLNPDPFKRCCPFCGKEISSDKMLYSGEFEIEHLLPFSRTFDDSRANKVISCRECNRSKGNHTPFEAFAHTDRWSGIMARVSELPKNKQGRFSENAMEQKAGKKNDVLARFLNDTKYLARVGKKYLASVCPANKIRSVPGQLTEKMRVLWGLNSLISGGQDKDRTDHRHHAVDAFVIACTTRGMLQRFATASEKSYAERHKILGEYIEPFAGFDRNKVQEMVNNMVVSFKPDHKGVKQAIAKGKTVGCLHEATNYGRVEKGGKEFFAVRKPILNIVDAKNIEKIANDKIRNDLKALLEGASAEVERKEIIQKYADDNNIKTVRIHEAKENLIPITDKKTGKPYRYVEGGNNYCVEIYSPNRGKNKGKWCAEIISTFDAHQKDFLPKWRKAEPEAKLIMRLQINDMVAYEKDGETIIARVKKLTKPDRIYLRKHIIAKEELDKLSWGAFPNGLQKAKARKIKVDILGRVFDPLAKDKTNGGTDC